MLIITAVALLILVMERTEHVFLVVVVGVVPVVIIQTPQGKLPQLMVDRGEMVRDTIIKVLVVVLVIPVEQVVLTVGMQVKMEQVGY
ncbi:MAG: hypothetical protein HN580_28020 [Deltaproteobacteria bacterium]|nr:hypothetical protein [Deltaproteobacteria bacterium]